MPNQLFGIDRGRLERLHKGLQPGRPSYHILKIAIETVLSALVPIPDCPNRWAGGGASEKKDLIHTAFHAIDEIKEERCTKCNGSGVHSSYANEGFCTKCYGTGKEPRKEECTCKPGNLDNPCSLHPTALEKKYSDFKESRKLEKACYDLKAEKLAKLSRYKEALEKIASEQELMEKEEQYNFAFVGKQNKIDYFQRIARTALEDTNH